MERMIKKAINAMKQSKNAFLPEIEGLIPFLELIKNNETGIKKFLCHEIKGINNFLLNKASRNCHYQILIGPEGDFTDDEIGLATQYGYKIVSLGNSRLRIETAGLVACILLNALNIKD